MLTRLRLRCRVTNAGGDKVADAHSPAKKPAARPAAGGRTKAGGDSHQALVGPKGGRAGGQGGVQANGCNHIHSLTPAWGLVN